MTDNGEPDQPSSEMPPAASLELPASRGGAAGEQAENALLADQRESDNSGERKTSFQQKLGMVKDIVQILAIVIGGMFAIYKFGIEDKPTLEKNLAVSGSLQWVERSNACTAAFDVEVLNKSKSGIEVKKLRGRAWLIDEPTTSQKAISYFDILHAIEGKEPVESFTYIKGPLVQQYAPGQTSNHTFEWLVERRKNAYALFLIEAFATAESDEPLDQQRQWDFVCGENNPVP